MNVIQESCYCSCLLLVLTSTYIMLKEKLRNYFAKATERDKKENLGFMTHSVMLFTLNPIASR